MGLHISFPYRYSSFFAVIPIVRWSSHPEWSRTLSSTFTEQGFTVDWPITDYIFVDNRVILYRNLNITDIFQLSVQHMVFDYPHRVRF